MVCLQDSTNSPRNLLIEGEQLSCFQAVCAEMITELETHTTGGPERKVDPKLYKLSMRHDVHKKLTMISLSRICAPISPLRSSAVLLMSTLKVSVGYNHSSQNLRQWTTV